MSMVISGDGTITGLVAGGLPDATVTQPDLAAGVAGNGPAFSAYQSVAHTPSANAWTKTPFQTKEFDTANCFDNTTNYRFTPNVAGYYQVDACVGNTATNVAVVGIYKNGSLYKHGSQTPGTSSGAVAGLVYLNGSTDYIEIYAYIANTSAPSNAASVSTYFQAAMVRGA